MAKSRGSKTYIYYSKVTGGYKVDGFSKVFKTVTELKGYFNKTSHFPVKFIKR